MSNPTPDLPRFPLLLGPSPVHRLPRLAEALGGRVDLWIKREDLLPLAFGGNKLRNLEFLVGAALAEGADTLVTVGRRWSNHARLTAAAGARAGLGVHLVLSGPAHDAETPGLALERLLGATIHMTTSDARAERDDLLERVVADLRGDGRRPYVIGAGGSGVPGAVGQVLAGLELAEQLAALGATANRIILPSATGGTQAGLLVGTTGASSAARSAVGSPSTSICGVIVARPGSELRPAIEAMVAALGSMYGVTVDPARIELDAGHLGDGYGRPTEAASAATRLLATTEGLLVDPIYTAKALAALIDGVRAGAYDGSSVVFWHAGGTIGLFEPLEP